LKPDFRQCGLARGSWVRVENGRRKRKKTSDYVTQK